MGSQAIAALAGIFGAIVGVAALAVIVSRNSNTTGVISASTGGFSQALGVAISPITGASGTASYGSAQIPQ